MPGEPPLDVDGLNHRAASRCMAIKERVRACSWIQEKVQRQIHSSRTRGYLRGRVNDLSTLFLTVIDGRRVGIFIEG